MFEAYLEAYPAVASGLVPSASGDRTPGRPPAVAGAMQAVRQKWTLLKTYRRVQTLWDEYKKLVNNEYGPTGTLPSQ